MNGRGGNEKRTDDMIFLIRKYMRFEDGNSVLDVGCGDARLLLSILNASIRVGTVLTEAERMSLAIDPSRKGIFFVKAVFPNLHEIPRIGFDKIIANSSLPSVGIATIAKQTISELSLSLNSGGSMYLGELFTANPFIRRKRIYRSKIRAVLRAAKRYGPTFAWNFAFHIIKHKHRANQLIEVIRNPGSWWITSKEEISHFAQELGLKVDGIWDCETETGDEFYGIHRRFSVLLTKPLD
jgi:SAM-dependent methyltransferase